jgi:hypothetical protein
MHEGATGSVASRALRGPSAGGLASDRPPAFIDSRGQALRAIARAVIKIARRAGGMRLPTGVRKPWLKGVGFKALPHYCFYRCSEWSIFD